MCGVLHGKRRGSDAKEQKFCIIGDTHKKERLLLREVIIIIANKIVLNMYVVTKN